MLIKGFGHRNIIVNSIDLAGTSRFASLMAEMAVRVQAWSFLAANPSVWKGKESFDAAALVEYVEKLDDGLVRGLDYISIVLRLLTLPFLVRSRSTVSLTLPSPMG